MGVLRCHKTKTFKNGNVFLLHTKDKMPIETTDTYLPYYTKNAIGKHQNKLRNMYMGSRAERWMIGISVMSGCPVKCKFCATGKLKKWRSLTVDEMLGQIDYVLNKNSEIAPVDSKEFKINWTRMGEPFLNIKNVKKAMGMITKKFPNVHHYISTIGLKGIDYSWIKENVTLQFSLHSFDENYRDWLIPFKNKASLNDMGKVRTKSNLKTTLNLTMTRKEDFDINKMVDIFDKDKFFIKISPINQNSILKINGIGDGIIKQQNII